MNLIQIDLSIAFIANRFDSILKYQNLHKTISTNSNLNPSRIFLQFHSIKSSHEKLTEAEILTQEKLNVKTFSTEAPHRQQNNGTDSAPRMFFPQLALNPPKCNLFIISHILPSLPLMCDSVCHVYSLITTTHNSERGKLSVTISFVSAEGIRLGFVESSTS